MSMLHFPGIRLVKTASVGNKSLPKEYCASGKDVSTLVEKKKVIVVAQPSQTGYKKCSRGFLD